MADWENRPVIPTSEQTARHVNDSLQLFVSSYLDYYRTFDFAESRFQEHVANFRAVWQSSEVWHRVTIPLLSFSSELIEVHIDDGLMLYEYPQKQSQSSGRRTYF
jgi:hypothetical protein